MSKTKGDSRPASKAVMEALKAVNREKEKASEYVGRAGKITGDFCEQHNLNRKAFTYVATMTRRDPADAMEQLCQTLVLAEAAGLFNQIDMFNDAIKTMKDIIERAEGQPAAGAPAGDGSAMAAMVN